MLLVQVCTTMMLLVQVSTIIMLVVLGLDGQETNLSPHMRQCTGQHHCNNAPCPLSRWAAWWGWADWSLCPSTIHVNNVRRHQIVGTLETLHWYQTTSMVFMQWCLFRAPSTVPPTDDSVSCRTRLSEQLLQTANCQYEWMKIYI